MQVQPTCIQVWLYPDTVICGRRGRHEQGFVATRGGGRRGVRGHMGGGMDGGSGFRWGRTGVGSCVRLELRLLACRLVSGARLAGT